MYASLRKWGWLVILLFATELNGYPYTENPQPRSIHVFVSLADNQHQGIVPVPAKLGNGMDPAHNLYWGAAAGVKTFFARSADWKLLSCDRTTKPPVLERCVFKNLNSEVYLVADAYRGDEIRHAILDFLEAAAGGDSETIPVTSGPAPVRAGIRGAANLVAYVGHDGLMDFSVSLVMADTAHHETPRRDAMILACASKQYFSGVLKTTGAFPLLWTTNLMAPEAYTLKSAIDGWIANEDGGKIRERAALAYDRYQKCGLRGARRLFASGW